MAFNPNTSLLAGMPTAALQKALADAQQAYLDLSNGTKGVSFSYSQGDGSRAVTYTQTSLPQLFMLIRSLQRQLGLVTQVRRPVWVRL